MASKGWERRNELARQRGYASYYDYRAHDYGRIPPRQPRAKGARLARLRGHRSAADLERLVRSGRVELVNTVTTVDRRGRVGVDVLVTLDDGSTREFRVTQRQAPRIGDVLDRMGTDAPQLVGSPRTMNSFVDIEDDEFPNDDVMEDYDELAGSR